MKKVIIILSIALLSLSSCSSGWSCKKSYVKNEIHLDVNKKMNQDILNLQKES